MKKWIQIPLILIASVLAASGSEFSDSIQSSYDAGDPVPTEIFTVRDGVELHYFAPALPHVAGKNPVLLYIHGGGWDVGLPNRTSFDYRVKDFWQDFSPMHNLNDQLPDTLVIMGDSDLLIKMVAQARLAPHRAFEMPACTMGCAPGRCCATSFLFIEL